MIKNELFTLVAVPESSILQLLNNLRNDFLDKGLNCIDYPRNTDVHISLASAKIDPANILAIKDGLQNLLLNIKPFTINYTEVSCENREPDYKCLQPFVWIALLFDDNNLKNLYKILNKYLAEQGASNNKEYIEEIMKNNPNYGIFDCIANHLNILNHCQPEKSKEVKKMIEEIAPKNIVIDKIALRNNRMEHLWEIKL